MTPPPALPDVDGESYDGAMRGILLAVPLALALWVFLFLAACGLVTWLAR